MAGNGITLQTDGARSVFDVGQFLERAAIMEFDGGMSRYQAETTAALAKRAGTFI